MRVAPDDEAHAISVLKEPVPAGTREAYEAERNPDPFRMPTCPNCASEQIVLDGIGEGNFWRCDKCDHRWTEEFTDDGQVEST